jgi:hypothetical protein
MRKRRNEGRPQKKRAETKQSLKELAQAEHEL